MGYKNEACAECTKKCLLIHGNKEASPRITSFFKVLVGDGFSEVLFMPPKFARTVNSMLGRKTFLEDSNGKRWRVKVSTIDGSLAFRQGWDEFASDHSLEDGQFLIFTYIIGSHFVVQIYDKSGCEKLNFTQKLKSGGKKAKPKISPDHLPVDGGKSVPMEAPFSIIDKGYMNEQGSSSTVPSSSNIEIIVCDDKDAEKTVIAAKCTSISEASRERSKSDPTVDCKEIPFYMIDRDFATEQDETRNVLFDLSNFEMSRDQSGANQVENVSVSVGKETSYPYEGNCQRPQASVGEGTANKSHMAIDGSYGQESFDVPDLEMTEINCNAEDVDQKKGHALLMRSLRSLSWQDLERDIVGEIDEVPPNSKKNSCCHDSSLPHQITSTGKSDEKKGNPDMSKTVFGQNPRSMRQNINDLGTKSTLRIKREEDPLRGSSGTAPRIITKVPGCSGAPVALEGENVVKLKMEEMSLTGSSGSVPQVITRVPRSFDAPVALGGEKGTKSAVKIKMEEIPLARSSRSVPQVITKVPRCFGSPASLEGEKGNIFKTINEESGEKFTLSSKDEENAYGYVKTEPMDSDDFLSPDLIDFCDSVTAVTQCWLELPTVSVSWKGKLRMDRKIVLLRDPTMKVWPVLYHERPGFRVLTSGWEAFAKANDIQPGDTCIFGAENCSEGVVRVNIVRRVDMI